MADEDLWEWRRQDGSTHRGSIDALRAAAQRDPSAPTWLTRRVLDQDGAWQPFLDSAAVLGRTSAPPLPPRAQGTMPQFSIPATPPRSSRPAPPAPPRPPTPTLTAITADITAEEISEVTTPNVSAEEPATAVAAPTAYASLAKTTASHGQEVSQAVEPTSPSPSPAPGQPAFPTSSEETPASPNAPSPVFAPARRGGILRQSQVTVPLWSLFALAGLAVGTAGVGFGVGRLSVASVEPGAIPVAPPAPVAPDSACFVSTAARKVAARIEAQVPVDARAADDGRLLLGFAETPRRATGLRFRPETAVAESVFTQDTNLPLARVSAPHTDRWIVLEETGEAMRSPHVISDGTRPWAIGTGGQGIVRDDTATGTTLQRQQLWAPTDAATVSIGDVLALSPGWLVAAYSPSKLWLGRLDASRNAQGALASVVLPPGTVGQPSLAGDASDAAVVFALKPAGAAEYALYWSRANAAAAPAVAALPMPADAAGGEAFAPELTRVPPNRWLVTWTEGRKGSRAVRAQTYSDRFEPLFDPIALSPPAGNFGQPASVRTGDRVSIFYLAKSRAGYELWGSVVSCL